MSKATVVNYPHRAHYFTGHGLLVRFIIAGMNLFCEVGLKSYENMLVSCVTCVPQFYYWSHLDFRSLLSSMQGFINE